MHYKSTALFFGYAYFQKSWVTGTLGLVALPPAAAMMNNLVPVGIQRIMQVKTFLKTIMTVIKQDIATVVVQKQEP